MDSEIENKAQGQSTESEGTREGGYNPAGGYQRNYHSNGRPQRPRINSQRAYSSDRGSSNNEGGFRPEGFGAGLQSSNGEHSQQRGGYQSRGGYGRPQGGGYNNNRAGGYQPRQQAGGYRPRYNNNNNDAEGGYQPRQQGGYQARQQGGYQPRQQGGYQPRQQGGYQNRQQGGGYNNNRGGGYNNNRGGGYNSNNRGGGYNNNRGGYNNNRGGYNNNRGGGYRQHTPGYDPNAKYSLKKRIEYKEENFDPTEPLRLNKFLANAGVCSRREADEFIQAGVVTVNGEVVTELGTKILRTDEVKFHDAPVSLEKKVYVLLNKPKDYVTTSDDPQQRKTVMDLVKDVCPERIYPVGRLDRNTTGVLLLTNDGDLADERDKSQVGIEIHSGKNRIVRRIFESLGYRVTKLDRVQFAGLTKKNLRRGDWRFLTEKEVDMLRMGAFE